MLRVTVELVDATNFGAVSTLAEMTITNTGTGTEMYGNYDIRETYPGTGKKTYGYVHNQPRSRAFGPWPLVARALRAVGYRNTSGEDA